MKSVSHNFSEEFMVFHRRLEPRKEQWILDAGLRPWTKVWSISYHFHVPWYKWILSYRFAGVLQKLTHKHTHARTFWIDSVQI